MMTYCLTPPRAGMLREISNTPLARSCLTGLFLISEQDV
jgi:hypothetical protein